jgi:pimeloyl-ACP methyl ester carboxylesterase
VESALPTDADTVCLVGHSFGGSVAMKLAARLSSRVLKLVLLEANPFYLLKQAGRADAFAEAVDLRNCVNKFGALGEWATASEQFADYWGGVGSWENIPAERRNTFVEALKPNYFEWDAVMDETTVRCLLAHVPTEASSPGTAKACVAETNRCRQQSRK